jgi:CubicO group peptidase (beta-lactamase class C family)
MPESNVHGITKAGISAFQSHFQSLVTDGKLANVVTLVARHGEVVDLSAYGVLDISASPPVQCDTNSIFRIASMTKPVIGTAMMMLYEEGKWKLDDPVSKHIPEFKGLKVKLEDGSLVDQKEEMKMKHLMSHTAGFDRQFSYPKEKLAALRGGTLNELIATLAEIPLAYQPGTTWLYSIAVDVQGYLVQKLSGQELDVFLSERLFKPLGMVDTGFFVSPEKAERVSMVHRYDKANGDRLIATAPTNVFPTKKPKFLSGSGGLFSTAEDYFNWAQMLLNSGTYNDKQLLKPETVKLMRTNVLEPGVNVTLYSPDTRGLGFGMDFAIIQDPDVAKTAQGIESFYWGGVYGTWFWIDPINELIVVGMIQNIDGTTPDGAPKVREASANLVYQAMVDRKTS